jgi:hypothetical protein
MVYNITKFDTIYTHKFDTIYTHKFVHYVSELCLWAMTERAVIQTITRA